MVMLKSRDRGDVTILDVRYTYVDSDATYLSSMHGPVVEI
jgi:hypothetical protein